MAKDTYYFSHDVNSSNDPKIIVMKKNCAVLYRMPGGGS